MSEKDLKVVLKRHKLWLDGSPAGERANLIGANFSYAKLSYANFSYARLSGANFRDADLSYANFRDARLSYANFRDADLSYADFRDADLSGANFTGADLKGSLGNMRQIKTLSIDTYHVNYTKHSMQIGCENHSIEEWKSFDDKRILEMEGKKALEFWKKYKDFIFTAIELSPAI